MRESICLQCKKPCFGPINRLVQDACGHKKCRSCLLVDEQQCTQCETEECVQKENGFEIDDQEDGDVLRCDTNGQSDNEGGLNNYTAVIQLNGDCPKVKKDSVSLSLTDSDNDGEGSVESQKTNNEDQLKSSDIQDNNFKIKKPDKSGKKQHKPIDIPKHITVISDPLSYHCTICDKTFITKTHVKYHSYCAGAAKPYKCDVCQKEFILRAQLDVHSYKHKSSKPFSCTVCKKSFPSRNKLTRHSVVHSNIKSHICSVCGNAYRSKESLKIHSVIHKGDKPYGCKLCSAKFNNQSNLNKHVATHSKEKTHMCDQCGKRFKQKWALSIHRRSHSRIRPHECSICHKAFVNLKDLQRHSYIHAGRSPAVINATVTSTSTRQMAPHASSSSAPLHILPTSTPMQPAGVTANSARLQLQQERQRRQVEEQRRQAPGSENQRRRRRASSSTDQSSSRLKRRLLKVATILTEISTTYQLLSTRKAHMTWQSR